MTPNTSDPHSIWLCPTAKTADTLRQMIEQIAHAQNAPAFAPHLTFLGDLTGPIATTIDACRSGFSGVGPFRAKVGRLSRSEAYFMAFYMNVILPETVADLRQSMGEVLTNATPPKFTPHVSLAYGELPAHFDDTAGQTLARTLCDDAIAFDQVAIVRSAKSIPIDHWTIAAKIDLAG